MNACNQCTETKPVPTCIELLTIGQADANTDYWVYIKNNATGYQQRQEFMTDTDGLVKLDMTKPYPDFYTPNFYYTIWVTEVDAGTEEYVPITINTSEIYECFTTRFEVVYNEEDSTAEFTTYSLIV